MKELSWNDAVKLCSPYPYTLVVTLDKNEKPNIMGLSWWSIVSWQPQMLMISVGHPRYTHECLQNCKEFTLCFPSEEQAKSAWLCGRISGRNADKVQQGNFKIEKSKIIKPPLLSDATAAFECQVKEEIEAGDHTVYIAKIVALHGNPDKERHLYTVHYQKPFSLDTKGNANFDLEV